MYLSSGKGVQQGTGKCESETTQLANSACSGVRRSHIRNHEGSAIILYFHPIHPIAPTACCGVRLELQVVFKSCLQPHCVFSVSLLYTVHCAASFLARGSAAPRAEVTRLGASHNILSAIRVGFGFGFRIQIRSLRYCY